MIYMLNLVFIFNYFVSCFPIKPMVHNLLHNHAIFFDATNFSMVVINKFHMTQSLKQNTLPPSPQHTHTQVLAFIIKMTITLLNEECAFQYSHSMVPHSPSHTHWPLCYPLDIDIIIPFPRSSLCSLFYLCLKRNRHTHTQSSKYSRVLRALDAQPRTLA